MLSRRNVLSLAAVLASQLCIPGAAAAQTPPADQPAAPAAEEGKKSVVEEIVVTGSRVRRKDLTTPAPVTVLSREQVVASGKVSIGDFLQTLPEQGNAINTGVNNGGEGSTRVNLRGIGTQYTLVLVNGRRMVPSGQGANSSVDLNSIPTAAIERIEVLKDGASAVYGSDAIAGVVNIITRRGYAGTEASAYYGQSSRGDGQIWDLNATSGTAGEMGSVLFSAGFYQQKKVMAGDRAFSKIPRAYDAIDGVYTLGSSGIPAGLVIVPDSQYDANGNALPGNAFWNGLAGAGGTIPNGQLFVRNLTGACAAGANSSDPTCWHAFGGTSFTADGYNYAPDNYLVTPAQRISLYSAGDTRFGSVARGYFEASYVNRQSGQDLAPEPLFTVTEGLTVSAANQYNPYGFDLFDVRRRLVEFGKRQFRQDLDTYRVVAGLDGSLPDVAGPLAGWTWDLSFNYGRTFETEVKNGNLFLPGLAAALGPSQGGVCYTDATFTTPIPGCVPLNLFGGVGTITPAMVNPLTFTGVQRGTNQLSAFQANVGGELVRLMSERPVGIAAGYEHRMLAGTFIFDPITAAGLTTGNKGANTRGNYDVNEVYGELVVPVVSGMPGAEDLELTGAVRWFKYSVFGSDSTYKLGARWRPIRDITFRGTYGTAFRAPSISDLYGGQLDNFANVRDPCRAPTAGSPTDQICVAQGVPSGGNGDVQTQLRSKVGGNPGLQPETAKIWTAGVVIEPASLVKNLSLTVDFYNLEITDNITTIGESTILQRCYDGSAPQYCALVTRDPNTSLITNIENTLQNVGNLKTAGIDVAVRYGLPTDFGRFAFSWDGNFLRKIDQTLADGTVVHGKNTFDLWALNSAGGAGGAFPSFKFNAALLWGFQGWGAGVNMRYIGSFHECGEPYVYDNTTTPVTMSGDFAGSGLCYLDSTFKRTVSAYQSYDLFASYALGTSYGKTTIGVGMQNVFDAAPAKIYNGFASSTDQYTYDQMGRFMYVRLTHNY